MGIDRSHLPRALHEVYDAIDAIAVETAGTKNGVAVTASEASSGFHKTTLTFTNHHVPLTDVAGVVAYGGTKIYDFPEGTLIVLGATANLAITKSSEGVNVDWDGDFALGTATASNNASLSATEADIIPSTATPQAAEGITTATGASTATECPKIFDGHTTAKDLYLNFLVDDADQDVTATACDLIVNGSLIVVWAKLGDF